MASAVADRAGFVCVSVRASRRAARAQPRRCASWWKLARPAVWIHPGKRTSGSAPARLCSAPRRVIGEHRTGDSTSTHRFVSIGEGPPSAPRSSFFLSQFLLRSSRLWRFDRRPVNLPAAPQRNSASCTAVADSVAGSIGDCSGRLIFAAAKPARPAVAASATHAQKEWLAEGLPSPMVRSRRAKRHRGLGFLCFASRRTVSQPTSRASVADRQVR